MAADSSPTVIQYVQDHAGKGRPLQSPLANCCLPNIWDNVPSRVSAEQRTQVPLTYSVALGSLAALNRRRDLYVRHLSRAYRFYSTSWACKQSGTSRAGAEDGGQLNFHQTGAKMEP